ncbi:MAG: glycosyltransferase [Odoribacter sp.]|nr:glycosyltransferase [Odoribacter sp.]
MKFSVLLSVYRKEQPAYLRQSLDSIFNQTLLPSEVVLVKDGPLTDALDEVIEEYCQRFPTLKVVPLTENQGLGKALNEGLKHCSYDLIARMDTDDVAKPERFEKQVGVFHARPNVDVVGAWIDEFEGEVDNVISVRKLPEKHWNVLKYARLRCPENHPVTMFRKEAVLSAGGYWHFPLFEDYYLWVRMLMNGACFYNIPESLLYFRFSPDMFRRRGGWKYAKDEFRFQCKLLRLGFIGCFGFCRNVGIRFVSRIIPNRLRSLLYKKVLR